MKHSFSLKTSLCISALLAAAVSAGTVSAELEGLASGWEKTIFLTFPSDSSIGVGILKISDDSYYNGYYEEYCYSYSDNCYYSSNDTLDLRLIASPVCVPEATSPDYVLYTDSPGFWIPRDTAELNLGSPLDLEDTAQFLHTIAIYMGFPLFIFQTNAGNYAFCRISYSDSLRDHASMTLITAGMTLVCDIPQNGTTTFDSLPQYPGTPDTLFTYISPSVYSDTITVNLQGTGDSLFFYNYNYRLRRMAPDSSDLCFVEVCATDTDSPCFYEMELCGRSEGGSLWTVKDTAALDFSTAFDLSDTSAFTAQGQALTLDSGGTYGPEQYFVALLGSGRYAFCHGTLADTAMPMACQVQVDGTPDFYSMPHYPEPEEHESIPMPRPRSFFKPAAVQAPYRVNGTRAGSSDASGVRVGKGLSIRE